MAAEILKIMMDINDCSIKPAIIPMIRQPIAVVIVSLRVGVSIIIDVFILVFYHRNNRMLEHG